MRALPVPPDFKERAAVMGNKALTRYYGHDSSTIRRWRVVTGVKSPPREGQPVFTAYDTPDEIQMCLNCAFETCRGLCVKMMVAKGGHFIK